MARSRTSWFEHVCRGGHPGRRVAARAEGAVGSRHSRRGDRHRHRGARGVDPGRPAQQRGLAVPRTGHRQHLRVSPERRAVLGADRARCQAAAVEGRVCARARAAGAVDSRGRHRADRAGGDQHARDHGPRRRQRARHGADRGRLRQLLRRRRRRLQARPAVHADRGTRSRPGGGDRRERVEGAVRRRRPRWASRSCSAAIATSWSANWRRGRARSSARTATTAWWPFPVPTARRKFPDARNMVLYIRALPGLRDQAREEAETILRLLRNVPSGAESNFSMNTRGSDHRAVRSHRLSDLPRDRRPGGHQPGDWRHRHCQRDGDQRDRADARDRRAAGDWRAAGGGAAAVPDRGRHPERRRRVGRRDRSRP